MYCISIPAFEADHLLSLEFLFWTESDVFHDLYISLFDLLHFSLTHAAD